MSEENINEVVNEVPNENEASTPEVPEVNDGKDDGIPKPSSEVVSSEPKDLSVTSNEDAEEKVSDIVIVGADVYKVIAKAYSEKQGWMKTTKAMQIDGVGCIVQVTTNQGDQIAEAVTFVPGAKIIERAGIYSLIRGQ